MKYEQQEVASSTLTCWASYHLPRALTSKLKLVLTACLAGGVLAACGSPRAMSSTGEKKTKSTSTSTTMSNATTSTPTTNPPAPAPVSTTVPQPASIAGFIGNWYQHDGGLLVYADGTGAMTFPGAVYMGETQTVAIRLTVTSSTTATAVVTSGTVSPGGIGPGTTFDLTLAYPGIQATQPGTTGSIPYCDPEAASQDVCGA